MRFSVETIRAAFDQHEAVYHRRKAWNIGYHIECWNRGRRAMLDGESDQFAWLYDQIGWQWKAFRNANGPCWSADRTFTYLRDNAPKWQDANLAALSDDQMVAMGELVDGMRGIKPISSGVSIVAVSKFLHFLNPRLFVIVDDAVIWQWILAHRWLWSEVETTRARVAELLGRKEEVGAVCDVLSYLAIIRWCGELLQKNPEVTAVFADVVARHNGGSPLQTHFEAAAVEWFLLGVVELPPAGVKLD